MPIRPVPLLRPVPVACDLRRSDWFPIDGGHSNGACPDFELRDRSRHRWGSDARRHS
jgi:hypothetical protein